jgi:hypothetical protein
MPNALVAQTTELARRETVLYARAGRLRHPAMVGRGLDTRGFSTALPHDCERAEMLEKSNARNVAHIRKTGHSFRFVFADDFSGDRNGRIV